MPATTRRSHRPASAGLLARRVALLALFEDEFRPGNATTALDRLADERELPEDVRAHFWRLAHRLDASLGAIEPRGSRVADAFEAIGVAAGAAVRRFGPLSSLWAFVSGATGGRLLCNTNCPYLRLDGTVTLTET